jgi:hypothetical protein
MNRTQTVRMTVSAMRERITAEYRDLCASDPMTLKELLAPEEFQFDEFCRNFRPHPHENELKKRAEAFGLKYGIWQANSPHNINGAWYLYPGADANRLFTIIKNLLIGFYLNDVMGRDVFKYLPPERQQSSRRLIKHMSSLTKSLSVGPDSSTLECIHAEMLTEIKTGSPADWFDNFLNDYCRHLDITHSDQNAESLGHIPKIDEYIENRCYYAGVRHLLRWIEYSNGEFLDWEALRKTAIYSRLKRLHWAAAAFPALSNDLFSLEAEVVDNGCDSNLVTVILLNKPNLSLGEAIQETSAIIRQIVAEIFELFHSIKVDVMQLEDSSPVPATTLSAHLLAIERFTQACWVWQSYSLRYKRPDSIWAETRGEP